VGGAGEGFGAIDESGVDVRTPPRSRLPVGCRDGPVVHPGTSITIDPSPKLYASPDRFVASVWHAVRPMFCQIPKPIYIFAHQAYIVGVSGMDQCVATHR
jgi:hypothetical protein